MTLILLKKNVTIQKQRAHQESELAAANRGECLWTVNTHLTNSKNMT